ncbi:MAG: helix-turn-helix domain-containing protein [Thermoguttaceae bacterium]
MTDQPFYSVKQVSELLQIRTHGVLTLIRSGELRAIDVSLAQGGKPRWRILPDDIDAFVSKRTFQPRVVRKRRRKPTSELKKYF